MLNICSPRRALAACATSFIFLVAVVSFVGGCTRAHYRRQADREVNAIIDDKALALGEAPGGYRMDVDPRSRMFDPNSPTVRRGRRMIRFRTS